MKFLYVAIPLVLVLTACGKAEPVAPAPARAHIAEVQRAPAPAKPDGGPQAPELSAEALRKFQSQK